MIKGCTHEKKLSQYATRSKTKIVHIKRDIEHNSQGYLSNTSDGVQAPNIYLGGIASSQQDIFDCTLYYQPWPAFQQLRACFLRVNDLHSELHCLCRQWPC
jgi:hypothetical protein